MSLVKRLDKEHSIRVRERDGHCTKCGKTDGTLQCAHIISRRYRNDGLRWDWLNCVTLCQACHVFFTYRPLEWERYVEEKYPGRLQHLKDRALGPVKKPDLEMLLAEMTGGKA